MLTLDFTENLSPHDTGKTSGRDEPTGGDEGEGQTHSWKGSLQSPNRNAEFEFDKVRIERSERASHVTSDRAAADSIVPKNHHTSPYVTLLVY